MNIGDDELDHNAVLISFPSLDYMRFVITFASRKATVAIGGTHLFGRKGSPGVHQHHLADVLVCWFSVKWRAGVPC